MEISNELQDAIKQQLPGMFASEMQVFIAQARDDAANVKHLKVRIELQDKEEQRLREQLNAHAELSAREQVLAKREALIQALELELLKKEAKMEANIAIAELTGVKETQDAFLKNVVVRSNVMSSVMKPVEGNPGDPTRGICPTSGTLQQANETHFTTETKE